VKALNDAVAYCDGVYDVMTDAAAMELVKDRQESRAKGSRYLIANISHDNEHYGNLRHLHAPQRARPTLDERSQQMRR